MPPPSSWGVFFVPELVLEYLSDLRSQGRRPLTLDAYHSDLKGLLAYLEGRNLSLASLEARDLKDYQRYLMDHYEASSVRRKLFVIRGFFRWAMYEGHLQADPAQRLIIPKLPDKETVAVTDEEVEAVLTAARRDLHRGEALIRGKGGHNRTIPLIRPVKEVLMALRSEGWTRPEDPVLLNRNGKPMGRGKISQIVSFYRKRAGIERNITPHSFRHGVATRLAQRGVDPFTIAAILGHRDLATTQKYVHPGMASRQDALLALDTVQSEPAERAVRTDIRAAFQKFPNSLSGRGFGALGANEKNVIEKVFYDVLEAFTERLSGREWPHEEFRPTRPEDR